MKGFMIYEAPLWGNEDNVVYLQEVKDASYTLKQFGSDDITCYLEGTATKDPVTKATCNKDDTYDFETGALIALMKMCGREKVTKACDELYKDDNYKNALQEMSEKYEKLNRKFNLIKEGYDYWKEQCMKSDEDNKELHKVIDELFEDGKHAKSEVARQSFENHRLEEENESLNYKYNLVKAGHDYWKSRCVLLNSRQNGKQYTALVELFKKIPQNKVDEAYKEAYNTKLPVWQREFLKEALSIYKPSTKREQMWNDILACGDCKHSKYVKVKKEDLETFAKECNEKKIFNVNGYELRPRGYWFADDRCIFQIFRKPAGFICAKSVGFASEDAIIDYLPPMRWDLFKKGRLVVGVRKEHYDEFISNATKNIGTFLKHKPYDFNYTFFMYNKDSNFINAIGRSQFRAIKEMNNHKVVYWEDVR